MVRPARSPPGSWGSCGLFSGRMTRRRTGSAVPVHSAETRFLRRPGERCERLYRPREGRSSPSMSKHLSRGLGQLTGFVFLLAGTFIPVAVEAQSVEGSFQRTLSVTGRPDI